MQTMTRWTAIHLDETGPHQPNLGYFDIIVLNHSGGKDSTVALQELLKEADTAGVRDRIVVLHNDLGRVEWPGTADLDAVHADHYRTVFGATLVERFGDRPSAKGVAERQAAANGLPFFVRSRTQGDLLQQIEQYGKFPDADNRHCTSEQKRGPKHKLFTELVRAANLGRKVRILDVNGERGEESTARKRKPAFEFNRPASNKTKRSVWTWRIVHSWTLEQVWDCHRENDLEWHWAYDAGMSRLSCSICVLGAVADLTLACLLRPDLAQEYLDLEQRINHLFKHKRSIKFYIDAAARQAAEQVTA
ncbi:phosphoadenosine phosphosulfate reductase family protein [Microtetraspora fusca]|uniref:Phosphoadenosine phosphosulfate reductase family protein n=1 Tax=Microtetraspora fusca TaxID=1997 RepID=A0ABW6VEV8_MICFU